MKKYAVIVCFCMLLAGCGMENTAYSAKEAAAVQDAGAAGAYETGEEAFFISDEEKSEVIEFLEQFEPELVFSDMDAAQADFYGEPLKESYEFAGRVTEDGMGYVLGFKKTESSLLDGLSVYGKDDYIEAAVWSEQDEEYKPVYTLENIESLFQGTGSSGNINEILYLQPRDMTVPEELQNAFHYRYCQGTQGAEYAEDVLARGVRFTPPDTGAYLSVDMYVDGIERWEYVALTEDEEKKILESDEVIMPELYGHIGLEFFVSQETYEKMDTEEAAITMPALEIAKERCNFKLSELSEIHDITGAHMKFYIGDGGYVEEELTDPAQIKELENILSSSDFAGEGGCPYKAVLTLTRQDGEKITVSLAADSCDGFVLESHGIYSPGKKNTERIWELFPEVRDYTGWKTMPSEEEKIEVKSTDGPAGAAFEAESGN